MVTPPARVLVVDDEAEIAGLVREILAQAGYEVATAASGAAALERLGATPFDAIVSDLRMPDMDGAALWREVSARHPELAARILFVTGDTLSPDAREFLRSSDSPGSTSRSRKPICSPGWGAAGLGHAASGATSEAGMRNGERPAATPRLVAPGPAAEQMKHRPAVLKCR